MPERQPRAIELPLGRFASTPAVDPKPSTTVLRPGHRNRLKPPFKLRHRGALNLLGLNAYNTGQDRARLRSAAVGHARRRGAHLRPPRPAGTGVRVRSTHRLVTPSVHRAAAHDAGSAPAGGRQARDPRSLTLAKHPHPGHTWPRGDPWPSSPPIGPDKSRRATVFRSARHGVGFAIRRASGNDSERPR